MLNSEWFKVFCRIPMGNRARSCFKKLTVTGVEGEEKKKNGKRRGRAEDELDNIEQLGGEDEDTNDKVED